jgi:3-hydroxybutyryl-CoA dehydratase
MTSEIADMNTTPKNNASMATMFFEDMLEGKGVETSRIITEDDLDLFSRVSGDTNPIHLDENYAASTQFKKRIAHGSLCASFISAIFGSEFPGPGCIYVSQSLRFKAPVFIGDKLVVKVTVRKRVPRKCFVEFDTQCFVDGKLVLDGDATLMVPGKGK